MEAERVARELRDTIIGFSRVLPSGNPTTGGLTLGGVTYRVGSPLAFPPRSGSAPTAEAIVQPHPSYSLPLAPRLPLRTLPLPRLRSQLQDPSQVPLQGQAASPARRSRLGEVGQEKSQTLFCSARFQHASHSFPPSGSGPSPFSFVTARPSTSTGQLYSMPHCSMDCKRVSGVIKLDLDTDLKIFKTWELQAEDWATGYPTTTAVRSQLWNVYIRSLITYVIATWVSPK